MPSYCIVDDDAVSRRMLQTIIERGGFGEVIGMAGGGCEGERMILQRNPDIVLIDLLMPDQDGIETINRLKNRVYQGKYVMISQIENKDMIGKAYQAGIEFYIQKPINKVEVEAVLSRINEQWWIRHYLKEITDSLSKIGTRVQEPSVKSQSPTTAQMTQMILMDLGIATESGSRDIAVIIDYLMERQERELPPLKLLYDAAAREARPEDPEKESKAVEQRIRRAVQAALTHIAGLGLMDYGHPKFEHYAPLYFDFQDIRLKMQELEDKRLTERCKVNCKKFLQVLYLELLEKKMKA
ncbi:response regulator [Paenibacillus thailandensis]|uniref:Response regulator n=1 Tax=Paenibacillus thailandensis TaxID=393250 RepID=A0ABW5R4E5_9BACL